MKKILSLVLVLIFAVSLCGCGAVSTTPKEKITQERAIAIALDSAKLAKNDQYKGVAEDVKAIVAKMSTEVLKRDLVSYYLSTGYQYVEQYGYSYEDTYNQPL